MKKTRKKVGKMCYAFGTKIRRRWFSMKRNAMQDLVQWKKDEERKPMVLKKARQVGKTWIMKEFGSQYYEKYDSWSRDELHLKNIMKFEKYTIEELKQEVK